MDLLHKFNKKLNFQIYSKLKAMQKSCERKEKAGIESRKKILIRQLEEKSLKSDNTLAVEM